MIEHASYTVAIVRPTDLSNIQYGRPCMGLRYNTVGPVWA